MALELSVAARRELSVWRDSQVSGREELRPVAVDSLHVTLAFLGYLPEREIERIAEITLASAAGRGAPTLVPLGAVGVPRSRPRLIALDLEDRDGEATALQSALSDRLAEARLYRPEKRLFWPHITLARVKRGARARPLEASAPPIGELEATRLTLYRSTLRPQGALYEPLAAAELGGG